VSPNVSVKRQGATTQHKLHIWRSYVSVGVSRGKIGYLFVINGSTITILFVMSRVSTVVSGGDHQVGKGIGNAR